MNENFDDESAPPLTAEETSTDKAKRRKLLGLTALLGVVGIWVASSYTIQTIFGEWGGWDKPFALTWINTTFFSVYFLGFATTPAWRKLPFRWNNLGTTARSTATTSLRPNRSGSSSSSSGNDSIGLSGSRHDEVSYGSQDSAGASPATAGLTEGLLDGGRPEEDNVGHIAVDGLNQTSFPLRPHSGDDGADVALPVKLSIFEVAKLAALFCPLWFIANYLFNVSLGMTSVASSMIISTTSSAFTLILGAVLRMDALNIGKVLAVVLCVGGVALVTLSDRENSGGDTVLGDILALGGAFFYACYTLLLRKKIQDESALSMPMFFAFLGLINALMMGPVLAILSVTGAETFALPSGQDIFIAILANALIGTVLSDYLWVWGMLLTSPLIATLGLTLTIPLSIIVDAIAKGKDFSFAYLAGAVFVVCGFVFGNVDQAVSGVFVRAFKSCANFVRRRVGTNEPHYI